MASSTSTRPLQSPAPSFAANSSNRSRASSVAPSISTTFVEDLEARYPEIRHKLIRADGGIDTPLAVLRDMAHEYGTPMHMEFHEVQMSRTYRRYSVEIFVGRLMGRGEASRRKLALHIASAELLEKLRQSSVSKDFDIPKVALMPGCRINPTIFGQLYGLCQQFELPQPFFVEMPKDPEEENAPLFTYKCQVGRLIVQGYSDSRYLAKRWAAKALYEALSGETVALDVVAHGQYCQLLEEYNLKPKISEQKIGILKYREESRAASSRASDSGTTAPQTPTTTTAPTTLANNSDAEAEEDDYHDQLDDNCEIVRVERSDTDMENIRIRLSGMCISDFEDETDDMDDDN